MHPFVALMRRYVVEYLLCQDPSICAQIMEPDYVLRMGGSELGPRDEVYVPAVVRQLQQFPGLGMTVHEIIVNGDRLAMRFSQHGASVRHDGRQASWGGIGLYRWNGERLTSNYAIEDYHSRRRQLAEGVAMPVEAPAVAPWDTVVEAPDPIAEATVRSWLLDPTRWGQLGGSGRSQLAGRSQPCDLVVDDGLRDGSIRLLEVEETVIDELFSAGGRVAFHTTQTGRYIGGLDVPESCIGATGTLYSVGVVHVDGSGQMTGRIIRERAGLQRSLTPRASGPSGRD